MSTNTVLCAPADPDKPKRSRKPAYQWVRFKDLNVGESFQVGSKFATKQGFMRAATDTQIFRVWPWTKVHSLRPVKKAS